MFYYDLLIIYNIYYKICQKSGSIVLFWIKNYLENKIRNSSKFLSVEIFEPWIAGISQCATGKAKDCSQHSTKKIRGVV